MADAGAAESPVRAAAFGVGREGEVKMPDTRLVQLIAATGTRAVGVPGKGDNIALIEGATSVYELAQLALREGIPLARAARARIGRQTENYDRVVAEQRLLPPLDHPDPMHCVVTGTGITHRQTPKPVDEATNAHTGPKPKSDGARLYDAGVENGRPPSGKVGAQPEWFYKGDGSCLVASDRPLAVPDFSMRCGEEAEIVGLYLIDGEGTPRRLGFALGNDLSDHPMEQQNGILLGHSKLRPCGLGPELLTGPLPPSVEGTSRIVRGGNVLWEKPVLGGETNMVHSLANIEHHQFKYAMFRRPGTVHIHYFGAMALSFVDGIHPEPGDIFEIDVPMLGRPLRNTLATAKTSFYAATAL
jgi:hypothetical protein